MDFFDD